MKHLLLIVFSWACSLTAFSQPEAEAQTIVFSPIPSEVSLNGTRPDCWPFMEFTSDGCCHRWSVQCSNGQITVCNIWDCDKFCLLLIFFNNIGNQLVSSSNNEGTNNNTGEEIITLPFDTHFIEKEITESDVLNTMIDYKQAMEEVCFQLESPYEFHVGSNTYIYQQGAYCIRDGKLILKKKTLFTKDYVSH